jgi:hypothetical protein
MNESKRWFADEHAKRVHGELHAALRPIIAQLCPGHELSHFGINRDFVTDEVRLVLHLNPLGRVRVVPESSAAISLATKDQP